MKIDYEKHYRQLLNTNIRFSLLAATGVVLFAVVLGFNGNPAPWPFWQVFAWC